MLLNSEFVCACRRSSFVTILRKTSANFYFKRFKNDTSDVLTTGWGAPVAETNASISIGPRGPLLLEDAQLIDEIAHFNRERIPERVVHAKGAGAFGYFEVTHDITKYCAAKLFDRVGKKTKVAVRFSTTSGERGSADTVRDVRGFAVKYYTDDGILDLVGNNMPVFFIRDPILFPRLIHSQKRNPATHLADANSFWDFLGSRPESTHTTFILFGDRGIPDGYRHMQGYVCSAYKMVNAEGHATYCKFHYRTAQEVKCLSPEEATCIAGKAPDYAIEDLYEAISDGSFPKWQLHVQFMSMEAAEKSPFNPFDITKVWSQREYPLNPVGHLMLNKNPTNYFAEIEQLGFSPAHMVPGLQPSPDRTLIGRMFAYGDTQRYRLGPNYLQLPVNCSSNASNYQRDGPMDHKHSGSTTSDGPRPLPDVKTLSPPFQISGDVSRHDTDDEDNFSQSRVLYERVFDDAQRERFVAAVAGSLKNVTEPLIKQRVLENFAKVDTNLEKRIIDCLKELEQEQEET